MTKSTTKEGKLAFVLSGGGSLGSMQVGCLEAWSKAWYRT